jgi:hypothetical protein
MSKSRSLRAAIFFHVPLRHQMSLVDLQEASSLLCGRDPPCSSLVSKRWARFVGQGGSFKPPAAVIIGRSLLASAPPGSI